jgi:hypothetical protein
VEQIQNIPSKSRGINLELKWTWTFLWMDIVLMHKACLSKFKKTEIIARIFSNYSSTKLELNHKWKNW